MHHSQQTSATYARSSAGPQFHYLDTPQTQPSSAHLQRQQASKGRLKPGARQTVWPHLLAPVDLVAMGPLLAYTLAPMHLSSAFSIPRDGHTGKTTWEPMSTSTSTATPCFRAEISGGLTEPPRTPYDELFSCIDDCRHRLLIDGWLFEVGGGHGPPQWTRRRVEGTRPSRIDPVVAPNTARGSEKDNMDGGWANVNSCRRAGDVRTCELCEREYLRVAATTHFGFLGVTSRARSSAGSRHAPLPSLASQRNGQREMRIRSISLFRGRPSQQPMEVIQPPLFGPAVETRWAGLGAAPDERTKDSRNAIARAQRQLHGMSHPEAPPCSTHPADGERGNYIVHVQTLTPGGDQL
ncbi:hypothetical protein THAOC_30676 [Thalassiosira oceanica]|uniref:Uncharacterized protein n=1 Tax=Thalassiosira oceanica TaxID=159749 RepID=K0RAW7_THAOC|nr:hypothetical protein THAOC_30676 [Thalassiosira oceanica]|eukprot:EJK50365.1 hypothetical protein THAOC_30676 [Thalassiosira oceanica]